MAHSNGIASESGFKPAELIRTLIVNVRVWAIPAVACAAIAAVYSLCASRDWKATQALIVRPEAASVSDERLGKFSDLSEMKTLQETILELVKSQSVIEATLTEVGPPSRFRFSQFPTAVDIDEFRKQVDMRPPGGAEFGKTEVFYLSVLDTNRERASRLVAALCNQLQHRMQQLRDDRAKSMSVELERTVAMADNDLAEKTKLLSSFEARIGADLGELRNLNATTGGQSEVSQEIEALETERRANETSRRENVRLLELLNVAKDDPQLLLATPGSLLRSQQAVSRLKDALVDSQVHTATLLGTLAESHPYVLASREAEVSIQRQLHDEIAVAIKGLEVDIELNVDRNETLTGKWNAARERLAKLAESRAEYANLVASVENHTKLVEAARKNLADARARQAGAMSASVISRIDGVDAGVRPVGPGRTVITAAGGFGGLALGLGFVFLFVAPKTNSENSQIASKPAASPSFSDVADYFRPATRETSVQASFDASCVSSRRAAPEDKQDVAVCGASISNDRTNGRHSHGADHNFGLFRGMTLEEAIRSVEGRFPSRNGW